LKRGVFPEEYEAASRNPLNWQLALFLETYQNFPRKISPTTDFAHLQFARFPQKKRLFRGNQRTLLDQHVIGRLSYSSREILPYVNAGKTSLPPLGLLRRQAELESAMKQPGGIRITEEQEILVLQRRLASYPQAMRAVIQAAHALRRPITEVTAEDVESWARTNPA
jgi:hypothetical protein